MDIKDSQESQEKPEGNTRSSGYQAYRWCFTLPYEATKAKDLSLHLKTFCKEWYFQGEKGKTGYMHWQGCFSLITKHKFAETKNLFGFSKAHLEKCQDWFASKNYCGKDDTRIEGPYNKDSRFINVISELYLWQEQLLSELQAEPDDRKITWIYNKNGGIGKTAFGRYLVINHNAAYYTAGKASDIACAYNNEEIVVFNLSRSKQQNFSYSCLESLKDGIIFSGKYESKTKVFNPPHIVVMANWRPNLAEMSADRWDVVKIDNNSAPLRAALAIG